MFDVLTSIVLCLLILLFIYLWRKRPKRFPPGPQGLPVIGVAHKLTNRAEVALMKMSQKYGPVMGVKLFRKFTVILSSHEAIKEAFVQNYAFAGRPESPVIQAFSCDTGLLTVDGLRWKEARKFVGTILRKFGSGKKVMEEKIALEATYLCTVLQTRKGKPFNIRKIITHSFANVICSLAFGERFPYDDQKFISTARSLVDWFAHNSNIFTLLIMAPFLRHIPPFSWRVESLKEARSKLYTLLTPIIERHADTLDSYDCRDFIDAYLMEIKKNADDPNTLYRDAELLGNVRDLFIAGTDTTVTLFRWSIVFLINRPHCQKKIQREIDKYIGPDAQPKMSHLSDMHYTQAFMNEMLRYRTPGPLGFPRRTTKDTVLFGYHIPKDTQLLYNMWAVHFDPNSFEDPEEFRPERFLDENGNFKKLQNLIPFSLGTRNCMGESIARMEFFIFVVILLQRFHLLPPDDELIDEECKRSGQFLIPPNNKMKLEERFSRQKSIKEYQESFWEESELAKESLIE